MSLNVQYFSIYFQKFKFKLPLPQAITALNSAKYLVKLE